MQNAATTVQNAIKNTPSKYWESLCRTRAGNDPSCEGSRFPRRTHEQVDTIIRKLDWEPYTHSSVEAPAQAFIARGVPGELGVTRLGDIPDDAKLILSDPKNTGTVELVWVDPSNIARPKVDYVVMLVGPDESDSNWPPDGPPGPRQVVWTFFPGDPVKPSTLSNEDDTSSTLSYLHGSAVSKKQASYLGFEWVKLGLSQSEKNLEGSKAALSALEDA